MKIADSLRYPVTFRNSRLFRRKEEGRGGQFHRWRSGPATPPRRKIKPFPVSCSNPHYNFSLSFIPLPTRTPIFRDSGKAQFQKSDAISKNNSGHLRKFVDLGVAGQSLA